MYLAMSDKTVAIVTDPDDLGTAVATGKASGSKLSYTHSATTGDLYVVGVDITDVQQNRLLSQMRMTILVMVQLLPNNQPA